MRAPPQPSLKNQVREFWELRACGTRVSSAPKFSRRYFDEIEQHRYRVEPEILSFAQFTCYHGKRVLEVGVGAGTDFVQWVRAGADASGIDLTEEAVAHVQQRLRVYGLPAADVRVADCEALPYPSDSFDLVYSWGVIHHTPNTEAALREIVRVTRPGGHCKIMVYNRFSLVTYGLWLRYALLTGQPWRSLSWALYHHLESKGTKGYTIGEMSEMLSSLPVYDVKLEPVVSWSDRRLGSALPVRLLAGAAVRALPTRFAGLYLTARFTKYA